MKVGEALRLLQDDGWFLVATRGSHRQFKHPSKPGRVTVPGKPSDDLAPGTVNSILNMPGRLLHPDGPTIFPHAAKRYGGTKRPKQGGSKRAMSCKLTPDDVRRLLTALESSGLLTVGLRLEMPHGGGA